MSILCVGQCAYDITFPINETMVENQKYRIYDKFECIGAPAANSAYLCSMWGEITKIVSRIGKDFYGKEIINVLQGVGVDTSCIYVDEEIKTPISCIITNTSNGSRTILNCPGILRDVDFSYPQEEPKVVLVDGHELQGSIKALEKYPNAVSIIDAGSCKEETKKLAKMVNYLICSEDFAYQYTGIRVDIKDYKTYELTFEKLKELNKKNIVVTLGERGLIYQENDVIRLLPAYTANTIDTTGAGDIFHGAFAYCIAKNYCLLDALKISSATSSISVETLGGQASIPTKEKVNERLIENGENIRIV